MCLNCKMQGQELSSTSVIFFFPLKQKTHTFQTKPHAETERLSICKLRKAELFCRRGAGRVWKPMSCHPAGSSSSWPGFFNCSSSTILPQIVLGCGNCLLHCGMVSSSPGFYLLDTSSHPLPQYNKQKYLCRCAHMGAQPCPTLYNPKHSSLPCSLVHGIF